MLMKLPKGFIYFLALAQAVLTAGHLLLYYALVFFFPRLAARGPTALIILLALSISFLTATILDFKRQGFFLRWFYILSSIWIVAWFYLLMAAAISLLAYLLVPETDIQIFAAVVFITAFLIVLYGTVNARVIRTVKLTLSLPNLPAYWKKRTAIMVSDLHLGHVLRQKSAEKIAAAVNKLKPDIVFIPGDVFDGVRTDFKILVRPLKNLAAPLGGYFCSGNHELYAGMAECEQALNDAGIKVIDEKTLDINGLQIAGIGYEHDKMPDLSNRLKNLQLDPNRPSILLKHVPMQLEEAAAASVSLQLSGHSHQGQVWPASLITKKVWRGFDYGLKHYGNMQIYTSSGVGTWGPPVRVLTQAEIVQITFI